MYHNFLSTDTTGYREDGLCSHTLHPPLTQVNCAWDRSTGPGASVPLSTLGPVISGPGPSGKIRLERLHAVPPV